jgi:hypothetical protein
VNVSCTSVTSAVIRGAGADSGGWGVRVKEKYILK